MGVGSNATRRGTTALQCATPLPLIKRNRQMPQNSVRRTLRTMRPRFFGLTENAGVENVAPSSGAYSGFQARVREVRASGDGSPPVEST